MGNNRYSLKHSAKWSILIFFVSFALACGFSVTSTAVLQGFPWALGMVVVLVIILVGIFFDILGLASAAAEELPFHAMASERVKGARHAIFVVRNADRVSNFCNDVIGDICGVISGAATTLVLVKLFAALDGGGSMQAAANVVFAGLVSGLTVGGKAMGKSFAIHHATGIVLMIGKFFYMLEHCLGIRVFQQRNKKPNGKRGRKRATGSNT